ncbi:MAG: hypothetical protein JST94_06985 [Bacteroidetes bacterium]|nr:hypothetical protein [Bacteroidota bacterium]MBS1671182.1 hypothetical protein [Bacteroidota bacterium]
MPQLAIIKTIFHKHRLQLLLTYTLFSLEMLGSLLRPFFLGKAVDGLIEGNYKGLIILSVIQLLWVIIGVIRHRYDTRTYSAIYTSLVTKFLSRKYASSEVSKLSAHSTLAREFVDFLEFDFVYVMEAAYNILGSLILLFFYDRNVVLICMAVLIPVSLISYFYGKRMKRLNKAKNDELEEQVNIIGSGNNLSIRRHYDKLRKWQIKISDQEAWNFGIMELMVIIVVAAALMVTQKKVLVEGVYAGELIGIYNYILKFISGLDTIPYTVQRLTFLSDITKRIELEAEDIEDPKRMAVNE